MKIKLLFIIITIMAATGIVSAQDDWKISAQVQLRSELDGRDFSNETHPLTFASLRTRLGVEKTFMGKLNIFVQAQDSRVFGEEGGTLNSISNLDLHQGYVKLIDLFELPMTLQAGRFEVVYGTERFFGAVGWHYIGRSWDGARISFNKIGLDVFALTQQETVGYIGNATQGIYPYPATPTPAFSVYGAWEKLNINQQHQMDFFGYYELNRRINPGDENALLKRFTLGFDHMGKYDKFSSIFEAAFQTGTRGDADVSAYLVSLQGAFTDRGFKIGAGADILSGAESNSVKYNTFDPAYGTNHKFYGYMDYFINIPNNTFLLGLNDIYLLTDFQPAGSKWGGSINVHHFMTNQPTTTDESTIGQEIDITIRYKFVEGTTLTWGGSLFMPGDIMKTAYLTPRGAREDTAFWTYLMITAGL